MSNFAMNNVFVHANALCEAVQVGAGTRIWAFAHVLPRARIGRDCNVCDGVFIENDVIVGDRVTIKGGVQLWDGLTVEDDVFIGPNATFTNDRFPRSKHYPTSFAHTVLRRACSIGANATILPGLEVGAGAMVGAGAVVISNVPPNAVVVGNPARISGYVQGCTGDQSSGGHLAPVIAMPDIGTPIVPVGAGAASLHRLKSVSDMRGTLSVGEFASDIPFVPKRYFLVFNVPTREVRGEHAHRTCEQFLICVRGSCRILLDDGVRRKEMTFDRPEVGLYMPAMVWGSQFQYSPDALLLVFASELYDPDDYIRDYAEFQRITASTRHT